MSPRAPLSRLGSGCGKCTTCHLKSGVLAYAASHLVVAAARFVCLSVCVVTCRKCLPSDVPLLYTYVYKCIHAKTPLSPPSLLPCSSPSLPRSFSTSFPSSSRSKFSRISLSLIGESSQKFNTQPNTIILTRACAQCAHPHSPTPNTHSQILESTAVYPAAAACVPAVVASLIICALVRKSN